MKNKLTIALMTILVITMCQNPKSVFALDSQVSDGDSGASLTISSSGSVMGYNKEQNPYHPKLIIPESKNGVTINEIAGSNFKNQGITEVVLPNTITTIGTSAFQNNPITKVTFPSSKFKIRNDAFRNTALTEITITTNMDMEFSSAVFQENTHLKKVTFEEGVTEVQQSLFKNSPVETINFCDTIKTIGAYAFQGSYVENVTLPRSLEIIYSGAFYQSKLKEVVIPDSVTEIRDSAFLNSQLEKVVLPKNLKTLGIQSFEGNKIKEIDIPATLKLIPQMAFWKNEIEKVGLHEGLEVIDQYAFLSNKIKEVNIPKGTKKISYAAFGQNELESVFIGEGVTEIYDQAFAINKIKKLTLPSTLEKVTKQAFAGNCLSFVKMPSGVTSLAADAFLQQTDVPVYYVIRNGKYVYQLPKEVDASQITEWKGYVDADVKMGEFDPTNNQLISTEKLTKITYGVKLPSDTVSVIMDVSLVPSMQKHHVVIKDYDGMIIDEQDVEDGQTVKDLPVLSRKGYTFIGWDRPIDNIQENMILTAQYKKLPTVIANDVRIKMGSTFNPEKYIMAIDADNHKIEDITIIKNEVVMTQPNSYTVEFMVTDKWGGTTSGSYQVIVYVESFKDIQLVDNESQVAISGIFEDNTKLIVSLVKSSENILFGHVNNQTILGSYEVTIVGNFKGKIQVDFPIESQYEGYTVYVRHMKHDGSIEMFTRIAKEGKVRVEVDELSPFIITIDKPNMGNSSSLQKGQVNTGDQTITTIWVLAIIVTTGLIVTLGTKRKRGDN